MKQILCLSYLPWKAAPNRTQQLLSRMNDVRILFFEPPGSSGDKAEQGRRVRPHITVYTLPYSLPEAKSRSPFRRHIWTRNAAFIRATMERHHFRNPVLWCTAPEQARLLGRFPCGGVVYDCHREWETEYVDLESDLANSAEVIFAASPGLVQRVSPCCDNVVLVPNGGNPLLCAQDEENLPGVLSIYAGKTILGRIGDVTGSVELSPLLDTAAARRDWVFLLFGRVTQKVSATLSKYPNIVPVGPINHLEIQEYLSACTILFDLKRSDQPGNDILPEHIYTYLATGKPVVMMAEPDYQEPFPDAIYTAYDSTGFLRRCSKALEESDRLSELRQEYARRSSWAVRTEQIMQILEATGLFT